VPTLNKNDDLHGGARRATTQELQQMEKTPLFSVITPTYNGAQYLGSQIESVLAQTCQDFEHIVIDDGSTDNGETLRVIARYPHLRTLARPNKGQYATMNEGLLLARGKWVLFLNQDDLLADQYVFERVLEEAKLRSAASLIYGQYKVIDSSGRPCSGPIFILPCGPWLLRYFNYVCHCSAYVSREFAMANQLRFDERGRYASDFEFFLRIAEAGAKFAYVGQPLALFRSHDSQSSKKHTAEMHRETRMYCLEHGIVLWLRFVCGRVQTYYDSFMKRLCCRTNQR
jgi:glycosyltransferase involved in cell wall biosynthesis